MSKTLLRRNTEYLVVWLPIILLLCSFLIYLLIRLQAHHMQEEQLIIKQENVWNAFKVTHGNLNKDVKGEYDITEGAVTPAHGSEEPRDTIVYYPDKEKSVPFKVLTSELTWNNKNYQVTTYISSTEITHLIIKVFLGEALLFLLLLAAIVVLNRKSSGLLWKPFFSTIEKVNGYDITKNRSLLLPDETGTAEFDELNKVITNLINKVNSAYYNQKQFVENASHEIQTPLAIIHSKLELMIDDPSLTEKNASMLDEITEATNKLSQMNKTLLLLSKIENNQFPEIGSLNLSHLTDTILNNLALYYENFPEVETHIAKNVTIKASRSLLEVLISNLLRNSVEHNVANGKIFVGLSVSHLIIRNTGPDLRTDPELLFERFRKDSHQTKNVGLGLALVNQICNLYGYVIIYKFENGWHIVEIRFPENAD